MSDRRRMDMDQRRNDGFASVSTLLCCVEFGFECVRADLTIFKAAGYQGNLVVSALSSSDPAGNCRAVSLSRILFFSF